MKKIFSQPMGRKAMMTFLSFTLFFLSSFRVAAQDVTVTVTPAQRILPPQVLLYVSDPGNYFSIALINNSQTTQNVYLALDLEQTFPSGGVSISMPTNRLPKTPISIAPGQARQLTLVEMKNLFNHIPKNEVKTTPGLFDNFSNGSFGMLPEGQYQIQVTAYKWDPLLAKPLAVSNPQTGVCNFTVCYKAQAPEFITPISLGVDLLDMSVAKLSRSNPQFTWKQPIVACNPSGQQFTYELRVCEVLPNQKPDDALRNATVYQQKNLTVPMAVIPKSSLDRMTNDKTYVAQITATPANSSANMIGYVMIENSGKSPFRLFKVVDEVTPTKEDKKDDKKEEKEEEEEGDEDDYASIASDDAGEGKDSLYTFRLPRIESPTFFDDTARKIYIGESIGVKWRKAWFLGGEGQKQDELQFEYTLQLFKGQGGKKDEALQGEPIYSFTTKNLEDSIKWETIEDKVSTGDYLVLRVLAECKNETSINWDEEDCNIIDFAIVDHLYKSYFQCSSTTNISNQECTTKKDTELKGKTVAIGEYNLTLDEIERVKGQDYFKGKGHVEWRPLGFKVMVAVKFDKLYINTEDQVYGGVAESYQDDSEKTLSNSEVVDKLFSDWGIDNLIGDTQIPYAKEIQQKTTDEVKNLAQKLDISKYYSYIKKGQSVWDQFLKGEVSDLHLPLQLPKSINQTPVDIQIVSMKFAHNYATMNVLGEFTLPSSNYLKNDILMIGAPRLCISPNRVLPESGTLALLGDFTIVDPESTFEFTFKAPKDLLEPKNGCFISWHADKLELLDIDVDMKIPGLVKVDAKGNRTNEQPILNLHASVGSWDDWFAEASMDNFEAKDLKDWTFMVGEKIVYDHSIYRNAPYMGKLPEGYDKVKAGFTSAGASDNEWQGLYIKHMGVVFPKMLSISDTKKSFEGRLKIDAEDMFFDASGATFKFGVNNVFDFNTAKCGGWGISMDEIKLDVRQNSFHSAYFNGKIQTPLEGKIGYRCDIYAQGKDAKGMTDPNRSAYIFKTQQVEGLSFDFWGGAKLSFNKDQTYFLVEAETVKSTSKTTTKVELCIGGSLTINIGRDWLTKKGAVGAKLATYLPEISVSGMRIANCERWKSNYTQNQYEAPDKGKGYSVNDFFGWKNEYNIKSDSFYFSLGRWSLSKSGGNNSSAYVPTQTSDDEWLLAQEGHGPMPETNGVDAVNGAVAQAKLGPFDLSIEDFKFDYNSGSKVASLTVEGKIGMMSGILTASATVTLEATADINNLSLKYKAVRFSGASFHSGFGGVSIDGDLKASTGNDEGYEGTLKLKMPGDLFSLDIEGAYKKRTDGNDVVPWGYFIAKVEGVGARFDPIVLKGIKGGFYFNCDLNKNYKKDTYGGMFGLKICTSGGENLISADMDLTVVWDNAKKKLSSIILQGNLQAAKGLVNSKATLAYKDDDKQKVIEIDITVKASIDANSVASMNKAFEAFAGKAFSAGEKIQQGLGDIVKDEGNSQTEAKASSSGSSKKSTGTFSAGNLNITLNIKITKPKTGNTKWHIYLGEPDWSKRCTFTLIDFQVGSRDIGKFGAWAYLSCNAYVCLGNELPSGGLPDPPPAIQEFLYGSKAKDINGATQNKKSEIQQAKDRTMQALNAEADGGFMFGAGAEGDFGVNAGIVYAMGSFCVGFDVMLKHFANGAKCQGGGKMGYHDFYGMGQIYAMLKGEVGVQINLWFWKGRCSLVSVGLGALLQGGMPNPTWIYGKVKASCKLLGGLFKFNKSIEFKAGKVCMPDYGDPLDNIEMFANVEPGVKNNSTEGYKKAVSPDLQPIFTTNYTMDHEIRLVDENLAQKQGSGYAERIYKFTLKTCEIIATGGAASSQYNLKTETTDYENFKVQNIPFKANAYYYLHLVGKAQEKINGYWKNPNNSSAEKLEDVKYYFKTADRPDDIIHNVVMSSCGTGELSKSRYYNFIKPEVWLNCNRDDLCGKGTNNNIKGYEFRWVLFVNGKIKEWKDNFVDRYAMAERWMPANSFTSIYTNSDNYRISLMRFKKGYADSELRRSVQSKENKKVVSSQKQYSSNQGSASSSYYKKTQGSYFGATSDPVGEMNNFFNKEEQEIKGGSTDETTNKMTTTLANSTALEMWSASCKGSNLSTKNFSSTNNSLADIYDCEKVFMTVKSIDIPNMPTYSGSTVNKDDAYLIYHPSQYENDPYYAISYLSKYMFLGGMKIKPYCLSNKTDNAQRGLNITLKYPVIRGYQKTKYDGALEMKTYNNGSSTYIMADNYASALPCVMSTGYAFNQQRVYSKSQCDYMIWTYDKFEVTNNDKRNQNVQATAIHRQFLQAALSDAFGIRDLLTTIRSKAKWFKERNEYIETWCNANNSTKKKRLNGIKDSWKDQNDNVSHFWTMNGGEKNYTAYFSSGGPANVSFQTLKYEMGTQSHFIWQLAEVGIRGGDIKGVSVENYNNSNYSMRSGKAGKVLEQQRSWSLDPMAFLKSIRSITYDVWKGDYYDFQLREYTGYTNTAKRSITVSNPFSKLSSVY